MSLPNELILEIYTFIPFEQVLRDPLPILKKIYKNLYDKEVHTWNWAAKNGHLEVIKFLHENTSQGCTKYAIDYAACNGHLEVVKFLHENRQEGCTRDAIDYAACNGHLEVVKFLHENRQEGCTKDAMNFAAIRGHLEIVKFLHENRTEGCTEDAIVWGTIGCRREVVKSLKSVLRWSPFNLNYLYKFTISTSIKRHRKMLLCIKENT